MIFIYLITLIISPQLWIEPLVGIRVDLFVYPLWVVVLLLSGKIVRTFRLEVQDFFVLIFIIWIFFSMALNQTTANTSKMVIEYIKWFVLCRLAVSSMANTKGVRAAMYILLFLVFIIVVECIQHKTSIDGIGWAGQTLGWVDPSVLRAGGTGRAQWINIFDGPGVFCVMFTIVLPFVLQYFDKQFSKVKKVFSIIALGMLLLAIWYTGSRGGFLATLSILGGYVATRLSSKLNLSFAKVSLIACVFAIGITLAPSHLTQTRDENKSAQHRVDMWAKGVRMVEDNPIFGIGRGNFSKYTGSLIAHNSAIDIMGETGLVGLFFWVGVYFYSFKKLIVFISKSKTDNDRSLGISLALCILGYLVSSMFVTLEYETQYFLLAMVSALSIPEELQPKLCLKDVMMVGSICLGWFIIVKGFVMIYY